jgi:hypothetical protein
MEATLMTQHLPLKARARRWAVAPSVPSRLLALAVVPAKANDGDAREILKAMSDYVAGQKSLSATYDADIEVVAPDLQKVQFTASGTVLIERPA